MQPPRCLFLSPKKPKKLVNITLDPQMGHEIIVCLHVRSTPEDVVEGAGMKRRKYSLSLADFSIRKSWGRGGGEGGFLPKRGQHEGHQLLDSLTGVQ